MRSDAWHGFRKSRTERMAAPQARSLMDDADFLSELAHMEPRVDADEDGPHGSRSTVNDLDNRLTETDEAEEAHWALDGEPNSDESAGANPRWRGDVAFVVVGFALMMAIGAAGAALVFHDRLALLLR
jgi:hypothetical protein